MRMTERGELAHPVQGSTGPARRVARGLRALACCSLAAAALAGVPSQSHAEDFRMGYVDLEYLVWHSDLARAAQERLQHERLRAEAALQAREARVGPSTLTPALAAIARRRLQADMERRQIEELQKLADAAMQAARRVGSAEGFDLVVHDALFVGASQDITQRVLVLMREQANR